MAARRFSNFTRFFFANNHYSRNTTFFKGFKPIYLLGLFVTSNSGSERKLDQKKVWEGYAKELKRKTDNVSAKLDKESKDAELKYKEEVERKRQSIADSVINQVDNFMSKVENALKNEGKEDNPLINEIKNATNHYTLGLNSKEFNNEDVKAIIEKIVKIQETGKWSGFSFEMIGCNEHSQLVISWSGVGKTQVSNKPCKTCDIIEDIGVLS